MQDDQSQHGNQHDQASETDNADESEAFAEADLNVPKWPDWEDEDRNVDERALWNWLEL